jgi:hypothetical protein
MDDGWLIPLANVMIRAWLTEYLRSDEGRAFIKEIAGSVTSREDRREQMIRDQIAAYLKSYDGRDLLIEFYIPGFYDPTPYSEDHPCLDGCEMKPKIARVPRPKEREVYIEKTY